MAARLDDPLIRHQALRLVASGLMQKTVARMLGLSRATVNYYVASAPTQAARFACEYCGTRATQPDGHPICQEAQRGQG